MYAPSQLETTLQCNVSYWLGAFTKLPNYDKNNHTQSMYLNNYHDSSDICPIGFIYYIKICGISHQPFGPSHRKCPMCVRWLSWTLHTSTEDVYLKSRFCVVSIIYIQSVFFEELNILLRSFTKLNEGKKNHVIRYHHFTEMTSGIGI